MILEIYNTINIFMRVDNTIILSVFRDKVLKEDFDLEYGKFEKIKRNTISLIKDIDYRRINRQRYGT